MVFTGINQRIVVKFDANFCKLPHCPRGTLDAEDSARGKRSSPRVSFESDTRFKVSGRKLLERQRCLM